MRVILDAYDFGGAAACVARMVSRRVRRGKISGHRIPMTKKVGLDRHEVEVPRGRPRREDTGWDEKGDSRASERPRSGGTFVVICGH